MTFEACAQVQRAGLAFDVGVPQAGGGPRGCRLTPTRRFRIERGGCFRGSAPLPMGATASDVTGLRIRAFARPPRTGESSPTCTLCHAERRHDSIHARRRVHADTIGAHVEGIVGRPN